MINWINTESLRPNRLTETKDDNYHSRMGRWTLNSLNHPLYRKYILKSMTNWSFIKGGDGQWIFDEDLEGFFLDESGDVRNRLKVVKNLIRPMFDQFIGNTIRLSFNARAKTTSDFVINKREKELNKLKFFYQVGKAIPEFEEVIKNNYAVGDTEVETVELFDSVFDDNFAETINNLLRYVERDGNTMEDIKVNLAKHLAASGLGVYKGWEQNGKYCKDYVDSMFFFWDMSAMKPDLSDSEYMGQWGFMDVPSLFERFQGINKVNRDRIEQWSQQQSIEYHRIISMFYATSGSKIPVYETYWKDIEAQEYGYVEDDYGYPFFTQINSPESKYTDKDLIKPPKSEKNLIPEGKKKKKIYVDVLRYCIFIPKEEISTDKGEDIVLECGIVPYQEKYRLNPSSVSFPYKVHAWEYDRGEVISPIDDAINPQRMVNRLLSVAESHINNARGTGTVIAKDAIDPNDGEEEIHRAVNKSKTIFVDTTRTGSVQNSIGVYNSGINSSINNIYNIAQQMQQSMGEITGVNESMTGTQGTADTLVGVVQAQIQRGSIVQEKFYYGLTNIMRQAYQHVATVGKRIYKDNPRRLAIMTGDNGVQMINITAELANEDFRVFVERTESDASAIQKANDMLLMFIQSGFIDQTRFSLLFNRAVPDEVMKAVREYAVELEYIKNQQNKMQQQQAIAAQQQQQQFMLENQKAIEQSRQMAVEQDERNKQHDLEIEALRGDKKIERDLLNNISQTGGLQ